MWDYVSKVLLGECQTRCCNNWCYDCDCHNAMHTTFPVRLCCSPTCETSRYCVEVSQDGGFVGVTNNFCWWRLTHLPYIVFSSRYILYIFATDLLRVRLVSFPINEKQLFVSCPYVLGNLHHTEASFLRCLLVSIEKRRCLAISSSFSIRAFTSLNRGQVDPLIFFSNVYWVA